MNSYCIFIMYKVFLFMLLYLILGGSFVFDMKMNISRA